MVLEGLPNTMIAVGENDPLRKESEQYVVMLKEAGVPVEIIIANEMTHGYLELVYSDTLELPDHIIALRASENIKREKERTLTFYKKHFKR